MSDFVPRQQPVEQVKAINVEDPTPTATKGNILSGLFASPPNAEPDKAQHGVGVLQSIHRQMFRRWFPQAVSLESSGDSTANSAYPQAADISSHTSQPVAKPRIDSEQAEKYLHRYDEMAAYFPFVFLPENWTLRTMLRSHPFLLLGILSAMSSSDPTEHRPLETEFRP